MLLMSDPTYEYRVVTNLGGQVSDTNRTYAEAERKRKDRERVNLNPDWSPYRVERRQVGVWRLVEGDK